MPATAGSNGKKHGFGRDSWPLGRKDFRSDSINAHPWGWSGCPSTPACSAEGPTPLAAGHPGRVLPGGVRALVLHACAPSKVRGFLAGFAALDLDKVGKPLARLAPETGEMLIRTSVLLVPLFNPVDIAENVVTLDHITHGRLVLGMSIGYREQELQVAGLRRKDRVPKLEESVELMKQLWCGQEVTFDGKYTKVVKGRMGFTPYQRPHPLLEMGAQSEGATKRAARIADGVFFGPQTTWTEVGRLAELYRATRQELGKAVGMLGASRSLMVAASKAEARNTAAHYLEKTFDMYKTWSMQEENMAELQLGSDSNLDEWAVHGSPADCVEKLLYARDELGLNRIGFTIYSLPRSTQARIEYLQMIAEDVVAEVTTGQPERR